jgi:hypothetical protein
LLINASLANLTHRNRSWAALSDDPIDARLLVATKHSRGDEQKDTISGVHSNGKLTFLQAEYF